LGERNAIIAGIDQLLAHARQTAKQQAMGQDSLFGDALGGPMKFSLPSIAPMPKADKLKWEKELIGLYVSAHPMSDYTARLQLEKVTAIKSLRPLPGMQVKVAGIVVASKKIITKTGKPMMFCTIEDATAKIEIVVFPSAMEKTQHAWADNTIVVISGKLDSRDGTPKILCDEAKPIAIIG
jgi:DNA polymerase-3 subunit alpha